MKSDTLPSIDKAIAGQYPFEINKIFSEAWEKLSGFKKSFWAAMLCLLLVVGFGFFIIVDISNMLEGPISSAEMGGKIRPLAEVLKLILTVFITTPMAAGLWVMTIQRSANAPTSYKSVFKYFSDWKNLWVYPVIVAVLSALMQIFYLYPLLQIFLLLLMLYFYITYVMFIPLVAEKRLPMWTALEVSRKAIFKHWFKMFWLSFLILCILMLSLFTAGIALIWTMPWAYLMMGILYRNMFGVRMASS